MKPLEFVIQKHAATQLHYDFRLQVGNVMPSWAIPKGPSLDNTVKRLAMKVEDHNFEYRHFEGILPEGHYGAGPVLIWDFGAYDAEVEIGPGKREQIKDPKDGDKIMAEGIEKGEIKFFLHGKKLQGSFALIKTHGFGPKNAWLLIKHKDKFVQKEYDASTFPLSAKSGKSIEQIDNA